jgi:hypothetical protein
MRRNTSVSSCVGGNFLDAVMSESLSLEKTNPNRLCLDGTDDAFDGKSKAVEHRFSRHSGRGLNFIESYEHLDVELVFKTTFPGRSSEFDLVFSAIPFKPLGEIKVDGAGHARPDTAGANGNSHWADDAVFVGITQLVQTPEKVIPSLVRLERSHDREDFVGDFFGACFPVTHNARSIVMEGEIAIPPAPAVGDCDSVSTLVKSASQVDD